MLSKGYTCRFKSEANEDASIALRPWFSPGTSAPSTPKTDRHDIAEIVLKVALNTKNQSNTRAEGSDMIFSHNMPNRYRLAEKIAQKYPEYMINY